MKINKRGYHFYTDEEDEFIRDNYLGLSNEAFAEKFNTKFDTNVTAGALARHRLKKLKIKSNFNPYRFKKMQHPWNYGKHGYCKIKPPHLFKKGNLPKTTRQIGDERENKDGLIEVKVKQPNIWKLKHHFIYENYYNIKIRNKEKVIFLDGDRRNFKIDNLEKISNSEQLYLHKNKLLSNNVELNKLSINIAKLILKIKKLEQG